MTYAYAYLVTGSEDGPIGIYSSKARAVAVALEYVKQDGRQAEEPEQIGEWFTTVRRSGEFSQVSADVERFYLN